MTDFVDIAGTRRLIAELLEGLGNNTQIEESGKYHKNFIISTPESGQLYLFKKNGKVRPLEALCLIGYDLIKPAGWLVDDSTGFSNKEELDKIKVVLKGNEFFEKLDALESKTEQFQDKIADFINGDKFNDDAYNKIDGNLGYKFKLSDTQKGILRVYVNDVSERLNKTLKVNFKGYVEGSFKELSDEYQKKGGRDIVTLIKRTNKMVYDKIKQFSSNAYRDVFNDDIELHKDGARLYGLEGIMPKEIVSGTGLKEESNKHGAENRSLNYQED
jgi:hypothetical protein